MKRNRGSKGGQLAMLKALMIACPETYGHSHLEINFLDPNDLNIFESMKVEDVLPGRILPSSILALVSTLPDVLEKWA
jgi:hypothetical protein